MEGSAQRERCDQPSGSPHGGPSRLCHAFHGPGVFLQNVRVRTGRDATHGIRAVACKMAPGIVALSVLALGGSRRPHAGRRCHLRLRLTQCTSTHLGHNGNCAASYPNAAVCGRRRLNPLRDFRLSGMIFSFPSRHLHRFRLWGDAVPIPDLDPPLESFHVGVKT